MKSLEQVLEQELRGVDAPAELWDRVEIPREARRRAIPSLRWAAVAAAVLLTLALGWRTSRKIDTASAADIQTWVAKRTGLRVPLDLNPPDVTRLSGARLAGFGGSAEIAFTAAAVPAILRVERSTQQVAVHGQLNPDSTMTSWVFAGQRYTLETSSPQALQTACRLCHG